MSGEEHPRFCEGSLRTNLILPLYPQGIPACVQGAANRVNPPSRLAFDVVGEYLLASRVPERQFFHNLSLLIP